MKLNWSPLFLLTNEYNKLFNENKSSTFTEIVDKLPVFKYPYNTRMLLFHVPICPWIDTIEWYKSDEPSLLPGAYYPISGKITLSYLTDRSRLVHRIDNFKLNLVAILVLRTQEAKTSIVFDG